MLDALTQRLSNVVKTLRGHARLTEDNVQEMLREVRLALLDADAGLPVVKDFVARVKEKALGQEVVGSLTPGQALVGVVHQELVELMGGASQGLNFATQPPAVILLAGLQGSGKTTFAGKLAKWLHGKQRRTLLASADVYRPAAIDQLERLAPNAGASFWRAPEGTKPVEIAKGALDEGKRRGFDFLILDTAGRLHVDDELMHELAELKSAVRAHQVVLVMDGMTGQEAVRVGQTFAEKIGVDGLVLTKMDGDARGGAALSLRHVTGKPIWFLGVGEKLDGLEVFDARRLAGRILGMGDVVGLVEKAREAVSVEDAQALAAKLKKSDFSLEDFLEQLKQMKKLGPIEGILKMLPGMSADRIEQARPDLDKLRSYEAILLSMTPRERRSPRILDGSRRRRIAAGSGTTVPVVNRLLKDFERTRMLMKHLRKGPRGLAALRGHFG